MTESAKDISSIYSSYNLTQHKYIETTENESYVHVKSKWLVFQTKSVRHAPSQTRTRPKDIETESI